jgi:hypothetical protein
VRDDKRAPNFIVRVSQTRSQLTLNGSAIRGPTVRRLRFSLADVRYAIAKQDLESKRRNLPLRTGSPHCAGQSYPFLHISRSDKCCQAIKWKYISRHSDVICVSCYQDYHRGGCSAAPKRTRPGQRDIAWSVLEKTVVLGQLLSKHVHKGTLSAQIRIPC